MGAEQDARHIWKDLAPSVSRYAGAFQELSAELDPLLHHYQYGSHSDLYRGYYCPSPVDDVICGNVSRGRLLKRPPRSLPAFEYGFDARDNLLRCRSMCSPEQGWFTEYVMKREASETVAVEYGPDGLLNTVTRCCYEQGRILCFEQAYVCFADDGCIEEAAFTVKAQRYHYDTDGILRRAVLLDATSCPAHPPNPAIKDFRQSEFSFVADAKGKIARDPGPIRWSSHSPDIWFALPVAPKGRPRDYYAGRLQINRQFQEIFIRFEGNTACCFGRDRKRLLFSGLGLFTPDTLTIRLDKTKDFVFRGAIDEIVFTRDSVEKGDG